VQHIKKGIYELFQRSFGCVSSYCKYVYFKFAKWEIVPSTKGWYLPWFLVLQDSRKRFCKRVAKTFSTISGKNQYAKFTKIYPLRILGGNMLKNLGIPKGKNFYGIRVFVVVRNFSSKGRHQKSAFRENLAAKSGFVFLEDIASGKLNPSKNVYQKVMCNHKVLKASYIKLKSKLESMTSGVNNSDLNDSRINEQYFINLMNKLKTETYKPSPTKIVFISKINEKKRPLRISTIEDCIVQQALLFLLEATFEKMFNGENNGFRSNKGIHAACKNIRLWKNVGWFITGDLVRYLNTINYNKLMEMINLKIQDQQIIDLLWKFFRAGVIIDGKYQNTTVDFLQGAIISPILSNIYLHKLDVYVNELKKKFDTKNANVLKSVYTKTKSKLTLDKKNKSYQKFRKIRYTIKVGFKLYYLRYVNFWLIGIWGSKKDVIKIQKKIETFLEKKLNLKLLLENTKITHAGKKKAEFLGYEIYSPMSKQSFFEKDRIKEKILYAGVCIDAPYKKLKKELINKNILVEKNGKWLINAVTYWINHNHAKILYRYNLMIKEYLNYYSHVNNLYIFYKLIGFLLRHSCALTLSRKLKLKSRKKVFKKFGLNLKDPRTGLVLAIPSNFKKKTKDYKIMINVYPLKILK
jgi:retron-type reverse transcriptase